MKINPTNNTLLFNEVVKPLNVPFQKPNLWISETEETSTILRNEFWEKFGYIRQRTTAVFIELLLKLKTSATKILAEENSVRVA